MLRLASLNIEIDRHFDRFVPLFNEFKPDVATLQEVPEGHIEELKARLGLPFAAFAPFTQTISPSSGRLHVTGEAIFSRTPLSDVRVIRYGGGSNGRMRHDLASPERMRATSQFALLSANVAADGAAFRVVTTHFPWSAMGQADDIQRETCTDLIAEASRLGEMVLTGDFNAPRGGEIFTRIAGVFRDNIPLHYTTSIDGALHRAGPLPYMVDGLFTTPGFRAEGVTLHSGLSDHLGITALVSRASGRTGPLWHD